MGLFSMRSPSVHVDWSLYGGAETTAPPAAAAAGKSVGPAPAAGPARSVRLAASPSSSSLSSSADDDSDARTSPSGSSLHSSRTSDTSDFDEPADDAAATGSGKRAPRGTDWLPPLVPARGADEPVDFLWLHTEEPHRSRRRAILAAHPEVRALMGHEPRTKYIACAVLALQTALAVYFGRAGFQWNDWRLLLVAYAVGGTANQNTFLAIHEITHNLAFRGLRANKALAVLVNCAIGVPYAMLFKPYHIEHHKHLGEDGIDTDLPTRFEMLFLNNVAGKAFFATFQILFYALRPGFVKQQRPTVWLGLNIAVQLLFNYALISAAGWTAWGYLILSSFFAGSLHPCAAHFIAEHYMFAGVGQETWSYYGPLNVLAYNVGYHNEHHDFPSIPWSRLPALRALAPEFYDVLPRHESWPLVTLQFILGAESGLWARIKRKGKGAGGWEGQQHAPHAHAETKKVQ